MQLSQNTVEDRKPDTKTNKLYEKLSQKLKEQKGGYTLMTDEKDEGG